MDLKQCDFILTNDILLEIDHKFRTLTDPTVIVDTDSYQVVCVTFRFSLGGNLSAANMQLHFEDGEARYSYVRPFENADISIAEDKLQEINLHFNEGLRAIQAREGIYSELSSDMSLETLSLWVTFEFGPGWRAIEAGFGDFDEMESQCLVYQPEPWSNSSSTFPLN